MGKHISGDVGLMTFDKDSQSPFFFLLFFEVRNVFSLLRNGYDNDPSTSKCVVCEDERESYCRLLRLNRKRN